MTNKEIEGFENYLIYEDGRVYNKKYNRFLKPSLIIRKDKPIDKCYYRVTLHKNGKKYSKKIHRLLAQAFIPNIDNLPYVDHIDRNPQNNNLSNLRWVSRADNTKNTGAKKNNKLGEKFISKVKNKNSYRFSIQKDKKSIIEKYFKTVNEAVEYRNEFIKNNPEYCI